VRWFVRPPGGRRQSRGALALRHPCLPVVLCPALGIALPRSVTFEPASRATRWRSPTRSLAMSHSSLPPGPRTGRALAGGRPRERAAAGYAEIAASLPPTQACQKRCSHPHTGRPLRKITPRGTAQSKVFPLFPMPGLGDQQTPAGSISTGKGRVARYGCPTFAMATTLDSRSTSSRRLRQR